MHLNLKLVSQIQATTPCETVFQIGDSNQPGVLQLSQPTIGGVSDQCKKKKSGLV